MKNTYPCPKQSHDNWKSAFYISEVEKGFACLKSLPNSGTKKEIQKKLAGV